MLNCREKSGCIVPIAIAAVLAIIVGVTSFSTLIPGIFNALWIAFGIGAFAISTVLFVALFARAKECVCENGKCIAVLAVGTIITTIIALSVTITVASTLISILLGAVTFFLAGTILSTLKLLLCLVDATCRCKEY